jgi:phospholipase C
VVISPYARANFVDHTAVDQTSIIRFIEDNWGIGRIGNQSYDAIAGTLEHMFDFAHPPSSLRKESQEFVCTLLVHERSPLFPTLPTTMLSSKSSIAG